MEVPKFVATSVSEWKVWPSPFSVKPERFSRRWTASRVAKPKSASGRPPACWRFQSGSKLPAYSPTESFRLNAEGAPARIRSWRPEPVEWPDGAEKVVGSNSADFAGSAFQGLGAGRESRIVRVKLWNITIRPVRHRFGEDGSRSFSDRKSGSFSRLEEDGRLDKVQGVTTSVANAIAKMTKRQKLALADRLLAEAGTHAKPSTVYGSDSPVLDAELRRRLDDRSPGAWLSLDEFRARTRSR